MFINKPKSLYRFIPSFLIPINKLKFSTFNKINQNRFPQITKVSSNLILFSQNQFSTRKQQIKNVQNIYKQNRQAQSETSFIWKMNSVHNIIAAVATLYYPAQAFSFIFTLNSAIQIYQSSRSINKMKEIMDNCPNFNSEQYNNAINQIKDMVKKILINQGPFILTTILLGTNLLYPGTQDYALLIMNFWILYNIKFNNFSHGYYFVLLGLLAFEFTYFRTKFQQIEGIQNKNEINSSKINLTK